MYCVGVTGVTGARRTIADDAIALLDSVRRLTPLPRALGFGLSTHEHLMALRGHAEAAVVGSALLDGIAADPDDAVAGAERFLRTMIGQPRRRTQRDRRARLARRRGSTARSSSPATSRSATGR